MRAPLRAAAIAASLVVAVASTTSGTTGGSTSGSANGSTSGHAAAHSSNALQSLKSNGASGSGRSGSSSSSTIYGVFHSADSINACSLVSIDVDAGANATLADVSTVCAGLQSTWPAYTAPTADGNSSSFFLATAGAASLFAVTAPSGAVKAVAPLPAANESDPLLGLVTVAAASGSCASGTYLVSASGILKLDAAGGAFKPYARLALPPQALVTAGPFGGAAGCGQIYVADQTSDLMVIIDLGARGVAGKPASVHTTVQRPMDFQFSLASGSLVMLAHYKLYAVLTDGSQAPQTGTWPNGPGFPSTNGLSPDGFTWYILDFANGRTVDLASGNISQPWAFTGAPRAVGFPVWL